MNEKINLINPSARSWTHHRYILWFGSHSPTFLMVWANSLDDALDECVDWIEKNAPGFFCDDQVQELYKEAIAEGKSEEAAQEYAEADTTSLDGCHYLSSQDWGIQFEDPTRAQVLALQGRPTPPKRDALTQAAHEAVHHGGKRP